MKAVQVSLPPELEKYAKEQAKTNFESFSAYIRKLIVEDKKRHATA